MIVFLIDDSPLPQAYLELVELLGNAALEQKERGAQRFGGQSVPVVARVTTQQVTPKGVARTPSRSSDSHSFGEGCGEDEEDEDAGDVLMSILTCHCITQVSLFQRLIRGAIRFEGVGASRQRYLCKHRGISASDESSTTIIAAYLPPPATAREVLVRTRLRSLERCSKLLGHCVRWLRQRQLDAAAAGKGSGTRSRADLLVYEHGNDSSEDEEGDEYQAAVGTNLADDGSGATVLREGGGQEEDGDNDGKGHCGSPASSGGGNGGTYYDTRPEAVMMATPRQCRAALSRALTEYEAAIVSAVAASNGQRGVYNDGDVSSPGDGSTCGGNVAEILLAVSSGLRELLPSSPLKSPAVPTATQDRAIGMYPTNRSEDSTMDAPHSTRHTAASVSTPSSLKITEAKRPRKDAQRAAASANQDSSVSTAGAVDVLPDTMKLRLMLVLERVYHAGRMAASAASAALAKAPSSTTLRYAMRSVPSASSSCWERPTRSCVSPPPKPCSMQSTPCEAPPPLKRRRTQAVVNDSKPGDQAAGPVGQPRDLAPHASSVRSKEPDASQKCSKQVGTFERDLGGIRRVVCMTLSKSEAVSIQCSVDGRRTSRGRPNSLL